jgi:hypothetical protein
MPATNTVSAARFGCLGRHPAFRGSYRSDDRCAIGLVRTSTERILFVSRASFAAFRGASMWPAGVPGVG